MPGSRTIVALAAAAAFAAGLLPSGAAAQQRDPVLAESLFRTGKQLFDQRRFAEACPKLAESERLDPAGGTLLLLGLCYEGEGKLASAFAALQEAAARARRDHRDDRERAAAARLKAIEPRVPRLTLEVADELRALEGLEVRRDGQPVPAVSFGVELMTDPGPVELSAEARGRSPWKHSLTLAEGSRERVRVGPLAPLPRPAPSASPPPALPAPPPASPPAPASGQGASGSTAGYLIGGLGLVAVGVGGYFGVRTIVAAREVRDRCGGQPRCADSGAVDLAHRADTQGTVATIALPLGAVAVAVGAYLVLRGDRDEAASLRLSPSVGQARGLSLSGAF